MLRKIRVAVKAENTIMLGDFNYPHILGKSHFRVRQRLFLDVINDLFGAISPGSYKKRGHKI